MTTQGFSTTLLVDQTPAEVFNAITNVRGWWSQNITGNTSDQNGEFVYQYEDMHKATMKLIEVIPNKKVVWLVLDNYFKFTSDKTEWTGTTVEFEISEKDGKTQLSFIHRGLVPEYECYEICLKGWTQYIDGSLHSLITTGKGQPNPKEKVSA